MNFKKMHGLGNDFVVLDQRSGRTALPAETIRHICDRRRGIGCDQLIIMEPSENADIFMRIYNPDGSESEACGNATRCVAHLYMKEHGAQTCRIETLRGILECELHGDLVRVNMGVPVNAAPSKNTYSSYGNGYTVNMGNPHIVFFVENAETVALSDIGPVIEHHKDFPARTNVEFVHKNEDGSLRLRVWERGAGITQACGSGACAVMVAAVEQGLANQKADIQMDGGLLTLEYTQGSPVYMTGPVAYVFDGIIKSI